MSVSTKMFKVFKVALFIAVGICAIYFPVVHGWKIFVEPPEPLTDAEIEERIVGMVMVGFGTFIVGIPLACWLKISALRAAKKSDSEKRSLDLGNSPSEPTSMD